MKATVSSQISLALLWALTLLGQQKGELCSSQNISADVFIGKFLPNP